jgi:hypothetical protein
MSVSLSVLFQVVAITGATVIDPSTGSVQGAQTIVVRGARIESVGRNVAVPREAQRMDGRGKFVIPGLWDMHVHNDVPGGRAFLPLYVAYGVTGVRDMNGRLETLRGWQREVTRGDVVGPRMVISGPYIVGAPVPLPHLRARTDAEGAQAVDSLLALGVDFIKVHNALPPAAFFGAARRARERGVPFAGHVFPPLTPQQASDSGQRSQEHLSALLNECTAADSTRLAAANPLHRLLFSTCTSVPQGAVYQTLARNGTWVTPTLIVQGPVADLAPSVTRGDRLSAYFTDSLLAMMAMIMPLPPNPSAEHRALGRELFERRGQLVGALARAGVPLLTGTDTPIAPALPGEAVHDELALLVRAGLTPLQALRAATWEPAQYLQATDSLGVVAPGKRADLVVLDANPLADIANSRKIHAVLANGRAYNRAALAALIAKARVRP